MQTILLLAALVFFALATAACPSPARFQWLPAGLLVLTLGMLIAGLHSVL